MCFLMSGASVGDDLNIQGKEQLKVEGSLPRVMVYQLGGDDWKAGFR